MERIGLIARKLGMTQLFDASGTQIPVTVLKIDPCSVVALRTKEKDGYSAVQVGSCEGKEKHINKPQLKSFEKLGAKNYRILKEFRVDDVSSYKFGDTFDSSYFAAGQLVDVTGRSVGKGFAGAIKRHGFGGLRATHGVSITHRCHGSTGNRTLPGKVFKNKRMAGHMGDKRVTTLNLKVHSVDVEKGVLLIRGCVPGAENGIVFVRDAIKKAKRN
ncbi:MAG: 50S ribosomal protein L3 [Holosporales bacterium]|jgi:large subunit ribosomal protein L3|nr:50S ribosomal protein L3 [Holosporales bacterium]